MARRRSKTSATGGNMDSMLDTLTNVVGILVIVLVAVQLSSQEAATRIAAAVASIDPAEMERRKAEAEAARKAREEALKALEEEQAEARQDPAEALERLRKNLAEAEEKARADARQAEELERQAAEAVAAAKAAEAKLTAEIKALEEQARRDAVRLDALRVEVDAARKIEPPPSKEVRLPNPRPLPTLPDGKPVKLEAVIVLCRGGRCLPIVDSLIRAKAEKRLGELVKARRLDPDNDNWLDEADELIKTFNNKPPLDRDFTLSAEVIQNRIFIALTPKPDGGETPAEAAEGDFAAAMRKTNPGTIYFLYRVEPESFGPYLQLRQLTDQAGFFAGWDPIDPQFIHKVGTKYMVGKKPPPPPPSPPPDPNAPKPPPVPPPKPPDVLD